MTRPPMKPQTIYNTDDRRWKAVARREQSADRCFYYAVMTTGIFCRPGCPSRLPKRENVEYFISSQAAMASGYRPCKKCKPTATNANEDTERKIIAACRIIENSTAVPKLADLARKLQLSPYYFHRLFKKVVGVTPKQFGSSHRSRRLSNSLKTSRSITDAFYDAGFSSSSGAYDKNQSQLSMKPKEYRAGGVGLTLHYGVAACTFGWIMVAGTDRGICSIEIDDDPALLLQQLQERFPQATVTQAGPGFANLVRDVVKFIKAPQNSFNIPLDIQGTAFQIQVWSILRQIEPGKTMSYTEVAEKIGNPKAVRAVAGACASNKLAVVIPCHRVISKNGELGGYRWGVERKKMLLDNEQKKFQSEDKD